MGRRRRNAGQERLGHRGAGFIGSHLVDALLEREYQVRIFDNLEPQVHGEGRVPDYFNREAEFIRGDVQDREALSRAIKGVGMLILLAFGLRLYRLEAKNLWQDGGVEILNG